MSDIGLQMLDISQVNLASWEFDASLSSTTITIEKDITGIWDVFQRTYVSLPPRVL